VKARKLLAEFYLEALTESKGRAKPARSEGRTYAKSRLAGPLAWPSAAGVPLPPSGPCPLLGTRPQTPASVMPLEHGCCCFRQRQGARPLNPGVAVAADPGRHRTQRSRFRSRSERGPSPAQRDRRWSTFGCPASSLLDGDYNLSVKTRRRSPVAARRGRCLSRRRSHRVRARGRCTTTRAGRGSRTPRSSFRTGVLGVRSIGLWTAAESAEKRVNSTVARGI